MLFPDAYRGSFHQWFQHLEKLRSILPPHVNVLACTATATHRILREVTKVLSLKHPAIIAEDPNRAYIMYSITEKKDVDEIAADIVNKFLCFPKTIKLQRQLCSAKG